ncbi:MAG TPA: response regulator [Pyrinomonadaceae bacterium]|nr:response regulator [Pyrinomonadaceae bacterium]
MKSPKGRILCTEDDPDTRDLIILVLKAAGYDVCCTENPEETVKLAETQKFDLYLMDNWLPDIQGPKLTARIREFDSRTPILFYSAAAYDTDKESARRAGAQAYLVKPVENDKLVQEVARLIRESTVEDLTPTRSKRTE